MYITLLVRHLNCAWNEADFIVYQNVDLTVEILPDGVP
jgi:hypothetical protein